MGEYKLRYSGQRSTPAQPERPDASRKNHEQPVRSRSDSARGNWNDRGRQRFLLSVELFQRAGRARGAAYRHANCRGGNLLPAPFSAEALDRGYLQLSKIYFY